MPTAGHLGDPLRAACARPPPRHASDRQTLMVTFWPYTRGKRLWPVRLYAHSTSRSRLWARTVGWRESRSPPGPLVDIELVAQREDFELQRQPGAQDGGRHAGTHSCSGSPESFIFGNRRSPLFIGEEFIGERHYRCISRGRKSSVHEVPGGNVLAGTGVRGRRVGGHYHRNCDACGLSRRTGPGAKHGRTVAASTCRHDP
jgi:hypothetical protein